MSVLVFDVILITFRSEGKVEVHKRGCVIYRKEGQIIFLYNLCGKRFFYYFRKVKIFNKFQFINA